LTVLTHKSIADLLPKIFQKGTCQFSSVEAASYNLRVDDVDLIIEGEVYHEKNPYPYDKHGGCIVIPKRKISVLTSIEDFKMPDNLVGRGGLSLSFASKGVIPLFGAQVDPHFTGKYIAILWNASNKDIDLRKGDHLIKLEFHRTDRAFPKKRTPKSIFDIDRGITKGSFLADLDKRLEDIERDVEEKSSRIDTLDTETKSRINELDRSVRASTSGYRTVVLFAIFLVASAVLGGVLNGLLTSSRILARELTGEQLAVVAVVISAVIPVIAVITVYAIAMRRHDGTNGGPH